MSARAGVRAALALLALTAAVAARAEPVSIERDGQVLNGFYVPAPAGGPVVLMLHGTLAHGDMEIMGTLRSVFEEQGWGALSVTLSLGESERVGMYACESAHRHLASDATAELAAWSDWLADRHAGPVVLLGHSRGALQMAVFAAGGERPGVEALVLVAPPVAAATPAAERYRSRFGLDLEALIERAAALVAAGQGETLLEDVGFLHCEGATVSAASFLSYYGAAAPAGVETLVAASPYPVLVVAGSEDEVVPGLTAALAPRLDPPRIELVEIQGADHFFRDLYAYDVVDAVQAFVGEGAAQR